MSAGESADRLGLGLPDSAVADKVNPELAMSGV
jgi:hypothetical protein